MKNTKKEIVKEIAEVEDAALETTVQIDASTAGVLPDTVNIENNKTQSCNHIVTGDLSNKNVIEENKPKPTQESRLRKTFLNARVNLVFYFINLVFSFFTRKVFLNCLGADFMGLTGTLGNILGFLNLVELGVGAAIGYLLYKPLYDKDHTKICEIISVMGYLYRWVGTIILVGGVILSLFLPIIFPNTGFSYGLIYFAFYSFLTSSLITYFINYHSCLLSADQRGYVVAKYFQTSNIIKIIIQLVLAYYTRSYYFWVAIELIVGIIYAVILNKKIRQVYPWLNQDWKLGRKVFKKYPEVMQKTKQLFVQKIVVMVCTQSGGLLTYAYVSLSMVAYLANYQVIITKVMGLITNLLESTSAGIGNLIAEGDSQKTIKVYKELLSMNMFIAGLIGFGLFAFSNPFIMIWLGEQYVISNWILAPLFLLYYFERAISCNNQFLYGYGMFQDIWAPIAETVIYILVSVVCGAKWGLFGILFGRTFSSVVINFGWKPYFLFNRGLNLSSLVFWKIFIPPFLFQGCLSSILILYFHDIFNYKESMLQLFLRSLIIFLIFTTLTYWFMYFSNSSFRIVVSERLKPLVKKFLK